LFRFEGVEDLFSTHVNEDFVFTLNLLVSDAYIVSVSRFTTDIIF